MSQRIFLHLESADLGADGPLVAERGARTDREREGPDGDGRGGFEDGSGVDYDGVVVVVARRGGRAVLDYGGVFYDLDGWWGRDTLRWGRGCGDNFVDVGFFDYGGGVGVVADFAFWSDEVGC